MIAEFFHAWERRLHARSKDRVVRPFDWGLDWIEPNGHDPGAVPEKILLDWASHAVADSQSFFDPPSTPNYVFKSDERHSAGELSFSSAMETLHTENNTVRALYFKSRDTRSQTGRRAVLVLPQWNAGPDGHIGLCRLLNRFGISSLRLTLPYHDARKPADLARADYIVSSNVGRTAQACRQAVMDARQCIAWLAEQGYDRIGILGTSLGSCLSLLTAAHEPLIQTQALNHVSPYFADVVWRGLSTSHVRTALEGSIDLERLRKLWMPISPLAYLDRVKGKKTLLVYAKYDLTFPVDLSRDLVREFEKRRIPFELTVLPCGHYSSGLTPFKYVDGFVLARFLDRNL